MDVDSVISISYFQFKKSMEHDAQDARFAAEFHADVTVEKIAEVYAEAFVGAAEQGGSLDEAVSEYESFVEILHSQPTFDAILASAMISAEEKRFLLDKTVGQKASPLFRSFLDVLARRNRLDLLRPIYAECQVALDRRHGRIPVTVTTAVPIAPEILDQLSGKLREALGGEPVIQSTVDPETIGGIVVRVGDTIYDASILTQLKNVRQQMIDRSAHEIQCRRDSFRNPEGN